jgi:hypothetical protein
MQMSYTEDTSVQVAQIANISFWPFFNNLMFKFLDHPVNELTFPQSKTWAADPFRVSVACQYSF